MASSRSTFLTKLAEQRLLARWRGMAAAMPRMPLSEVRALQQRLRPMATELTQLDRLATKRLNGMADAIRKPRGTDWAYRPRLWREKLDHPARSAVTSPASLDGESTLFHDCSLAEVSLRQCPTRSAEALSPFDMRLEVLHFQGSFLSLSIDLPSSVLDGLQADHMIEVAPDLTSDRGGDLYLRLNLHHDQETKQILHTLPASDTQRTVTFDLSYNDVTPRMIDKIWLDVIFPDPAMTLFQLSDLTLTRRPRADF